VLRVLRKAALAVLASRGCLRRMAERVAVARLVLVKKTINVEVVHQVQTRRQTEEMKVRQNLLHARGAVAVHVALLDRSLIEVVQLAVNLVSLQLVTWAIKSSSILLNRMMTTEKQEVEAGQQALAKTRMNTFHVKRKVVQHVSTRVEVGLPVRRIRRVVVVPSLEAQRKLEVEAVQAVMARIGTEVVQETAARPEVLHQARNGAEREVVASQKSVPQVLQRTRIVVALPVARKTRAIRQDVARMTVSCKAQKGRNHEAVHGKILRATIKLVEATHAVCLAHAAGHHLLESHVVRLKATRSRDASLPTETEICIL